MGGSQSSSAPPPPPPPPPTAPPPVTQSTGATYTTTEQTFPVSLRTSGSGPYYDSSCSGNELTVERFNTYQSPGVDANHSRCLPDGIWPANKRYCPAEATVGGTITAVEIVDGKNGKIKCTYTGIPPSKLSDNAVMALFPNNGADLKRDFCTGITDPQTLYDNRAVCQPVLDAQAGGYEAKMIGLCASNKKDTWPTIPVCFEALKVAAQNGGVNGNSAVDAIKKYCRGDDITNEKGMGPGRTSKNIACACLNARDFGFKDADPNNRTSCLATANQDLPGCDKINARLGSLVESGGAGYQVIQAISNDSGCLSSDCDLAKQLGSDSQIFPYQPNTASCPNVDLNVCDIAINQRVGLNSPILATCNFPSDGGAATPSIGPVSTPTAATPGASPEDQDDEALPVTWEPFANIFNTEMKQYGFFACCCITCVLLILIIVLMSSGPSGPSAQNLALAKLASI